MKTLFFIISTTRKTGPRKQTLQIINQLRSRGIQDVKLIVISKLGYLKFLVYIIRQRNVILVSTGLLPDILSALAHLISSKKKRFITYVRCDFKADYTSKFGACTGKILSFTHYLVLTRCDNILCVSRDIWRKLEKRYQNNTTLLPNPIEINQNCYQFKNTTDEKKAIVLGYAGSNLPRKRVKEVIKFTEKYSGELNFQLEIFGFDRPDNFLVERVNFNGFVSKDEIFSRIDLLILLSSSEGTPNVVLEALACGIPVIASDIPPHKDLADEFAQWPIFLCNADDLESIRAAYQNARSFSIHKTLHVPELYTIENRLRKFQELIASDLN